MQKTERWLLDCDISVDYRKKNITFSNKESLFSRKTYRTIASFSLYLTLFLFVFALIVDFSLILDSLWIFPLCFVLCFVGTFVLALPMTSENSFYRNLYFKWRTRTVRKRVVIQNPEGIIRYITRDTDPFIDLEYDEDIRQKLLSVELKKIPKKGRFDSRSKRGKNEMIITLSGKAEGELIIKEY